MLRLSRFKQLSLSKRKKLLSLLVVIIFLVTLAVITMEVRQRQEIRTPAAEPPSSHPRAPFPITKKVLILEFNPIIESRNSHRLNLVESWNNPQELEEQYIKDVAEVSGGYLNYQIVEKQILDVYPVKSDGFQYTDETYLDCWEKGIKCHDPDIINYRKMLTDYQVCEKRNSGEIDELWLWGAPYFGYAEANMAGPNAFWLNGPIIKNTTCTKQLPIMGFNYEKGVSEMLEDLGHRIEGTMAHLFEKWSLCSPSLFDNYTATEMDCPGKAACGNVHVPANGQEGYDWSNKRYVDNSCEDWLNYPNLTGTKISSNCDVWNCDALSWKKYWLSHLPQFAGQTNDKWNNWWSYIADYEEATNPNLPKGTHDPSANCTLNGWTCDPNLYSQPLTVEFYEYNILVGQTTADIPAEPAVSSLCGNNPSHRFVYTFPPNNPIYNNQNHTIKAVALDINADGQPSGKRTDLTQTPLSIVCPPTPPSTSPPPVPVPACGTNFNVTCSANGKRATFSWDAIPNAIYYWLRLNKEPYADWRNLDDGDQDPEINIPYPNPPSVLLDITPGAKYQYDIQGFNVQNEAGCRMPFAEFSCGVQPTRRFQSPRPTHLL